MRLPDGFKEKYQKLLGEEAQPFLASFDQTVEKGFRINPLKGTVKLHDHLIDQPISYSDWGYYGKVNGKTIDHQSGLVYSQELVRCWLAKLLTRNQAKKFWIFVRPLAVKPRI